jgi:hypothetical protein
MTTTTHECTGFNVQRGVLADLAHEVDGVRYIGAAGQRLDEALQHTYDAELQALLADVETVVATGRCSPGALVHLRRRLYEIVGPLGGPGDQVPADMTTRDPVSWPPQLATAPDQIPDPRPVTDLNAEQAARTRGDQPDDDQDPATQPLQDAIGGSRRKARRSNE